MSAATGHHFARPGNRFWPALYRSGFTPHQLLPAEQHELLAYGLGITNIVDRPSATAAELGRDELVAGGNQLAEKVRRWRPDWLAVVGITAYRIAFGEPKAKLGRQDRVIVSTKVWILPNPSGLNAHFTPTTLAAAFAELRAAAIRATN